MLTIEKKNSKIFKPSPLDNRNKSNQFKTFKRRPFHLFNIPCMFNLRPVSKEFIINIQNNSVKNDKIGN